MNLLRPLMISFGFLTRLPVKTGRVNETDLGRSVSFFPLVGLALGLAMVGMAKLGEGYLSGGLIALGIVGFLVLMTGGLHLDGLADLFDGLGGSGRDRERMLAIMRDSRIGAYGTIALFFLLAGKVLAVVEILSRHDLWVLVAAPVASRWAVTPLVIFFPYARKEGLGRAFNGQGRSLHVVIATTFMAILSCGVGLRSVAPTLAALVVALGLGVWIRRRLGGLTGDVYGAAIELSELTFLCTFLISRH